MMCVLPALFLSRIHEIPLAPPYVCARVFFEKPEHGALMSAKSAVANLMTFLDSKRNGDTRMS
jgi:hypothetical protein